MARKRTNGRPTAAQIRRAVIDRADEFSRLTGMAKSAIGKQAVNDSAFLIDVEAGGNLTLNRYERFMSWLDSNWPKGRAEAGRKPA